MTRSDKKNRTCEQCGKVCANPNKLREHLNRKFKCKPKPVQATTLQAKGQEGTSSQPVQAPTPQVKGQGGIPVVHVRGNDRRREKPEPISQVQIQQKDTEAGFGPTTQVYREG